jgi:hypothetical protein
MITRWMDAVAHADTQGQQKSPVTHEKMKPTVSIGGKEMLNELGAGLE